MEVTRLFDIIEHRKAFHPERAVFDRKANGVWEKHYIEEYAATSNEISLGLLALEVKRGENVGLISSGRPEWNYIDFGVQQIGAVLVPIYPTISESEYEYILDHSGVRFLILENHELTKKIEAIRARLPQLQEVFVIEPCEGYRTLKDLASLGSTTQSKEVDAIKASIRPDDVVTMIYTSGTTGTPKGVMLTHKGILMNVMGIKESPSKDWTTALSWMPLCHIYERMMNYLYQYLALEVYYAESIGKVAENAQEAHPNIMAAVPRFIEKVYDKIYRKGEKLKGLKKKIFFWALDLGFQYDLDESKLSPWYKLKRSVADKLVFGQIRESLGGQLEMLVSGGASIQPRLTRFFSCVGLDLYEGYGLTECSPLIAVTNSDPKGRKIGSVGFALDGVEVKIDEATGEILCRGDNVMKGYYHAPDLTAEAIDGEGWFHTGDVGHFDAEGYLFLTGRTKSMFKTAMGKFVNPEVIEERFKESPFVQDMMVVGEDQKFAAALILPDFDFLKEWQHRHGIEGCNSREEMVKEENTIARYKKVLVKYNATLGNTEQIKRFALVTDTWTQGNGMLTPTLKIKRKVIAAHYEREIRELFK